MVSSPSAAQQASENEQRRRKQTLERAKANHLSRQLQMRLQYARLKVEHGWQKQNLNEVENLYFHHSHLQGPRPLLSSVATYPQSDVLQTTPASVNSTPQPSTSSLSFKLGSSKLSRIPTSVQENEEAMPDPESSSTASLVNSNTDPSMTQRSATIPALDISLTPSHKSTLISMDLGEEKKTQTPSILEVPQVEPPFKPTTTLSPRSPLTSNSTWPALAASHVIRTPPQSAILPKSNYTPSTPGNGKLSGGKNSTSYSSTLTYDSFWSSHSTSSKTWNALGTTPSSAVPSPDGAEKSDRTGGRARTGVRVGGEGRGVR